MDEIFKAQLDRWHDEDDHVRIIDAIRKIPPSDWDYDLVGKLARAYNNVDDYEAAIDLLESVRDEGKGDFLWHFRLGYAYYYMSKYADAFREFETANQINPGDEDTEVFMYLCLSGIEERVFFNSSSNFICLNRRKNRTAKTWKFRDNGSQDMILLYDCKMTSVTAAGEDLIFEFEDGFFVDEDHLENPYDMTLRTGKSQLILKNGKLLRDAKTRSADWEDFARKISGKSFEIVEEKREFENDERIVVYNGRVWSGGKPDFESEPVFSYESLVYVWDDIREDAPW
ncbi:tetratricopeptide repeat protein [Methanolapillus millepedarum]|uniref:Tetratricopeptide repeat protein n=1 Tax=Methanolapillus millepedarum TaxID=3028296 RepID=A0AA96V604_9EURY|nr:hypothetical protein MsAc7_12860 [Methanosarcinaceae archaeon Ac7]